MSQAITLFLSSAGESRWLHPLRGPGRGSLDQLPAAGRLPLQVVVPGEAVHVCAVSLPGRQLKRKLQALPFALEEQLIQDVDRYHCVLGPSLADGRQLAAAVERIVLDPWLEQLREHSLEAERLVPSTLCVPEPKAADEAVVVIAEGRALVRVGADRAYAVGVDELDTMLQLEQGLNSLLFADPDGRWQSQLAIDRQPLTMAGSIDELLAAQLNSSSLNLLQGAYQSRGEVGARAGALWRRVALCGAAVLLLAVVSRYIDYRSGVAERRVLEQQVTATVERALGQTPAGFEPLQARALLEARLSALRGNAGTSVDGLLFLLHAVGPKIAGGSGVRLESLVYRPDGLMLELRADGLAAIESLRQRIGQETGVAVALESASQLADGTGARLRIGGDAQ